MSVEVAPDVALAPVDDDDDLIHTYCCDPSRSLCGLTFDDDDIEWPEGSYPNDCVVCEDLAGSPCGFPGCGDPS